MDLTTITYSDFKDQFPRDFPYLKVWSASETYNLDDEVYYSVDSKFYRCLDNGVTTVPTTAGDWDEFLDNQNNYIKESDVNRAFVEAKIVFNQALFGTEAQIKVGYLYVTAHFLVIDMQNAIEGITSKGSQIVNSRSVGSVSESYTIPERFIKDINLNPYTRTGYGLKYLSLVVSKLVGNVKAIKGATLP